MSTPATLEKGSLKILPYCSGATSNPDKKSLLDLPREVRDLIYEYVIAVMRKDARQSLPDREIGKHPSRVVGAHAAAYCKHSNIHAYGEKVLKLLQAKSQYVTLDPRTCRVENDWLQDMSLVSKHFGSETLAVLFQTTIFHFDKEVEIEDSQPLPPTKDYKQIIAALGARAKNLRRLAISVFYDCSELDGNWDWREEHYDDVETDEAEEELKPLEGQLHPSVSIFLAVERSWSDGMGRSSFHVTVSGVDGFTLVARRLQSADEIKPFIAYLEHFGYYPEALPYFS